MPSNMGSRTAEETEEERKTDTPSKVDEAREKMKSVLFFRKKKSELEFLAIGYF